MTMWTRVRLAETGGEAIVPVDALETWMAARGWQAHGEPTEDRGFLVAQVDQEKQEAELAARQEADRLAVTGADGTKADVLAEVGDDPVRARAALEAEQAKDKPRSTLVAELNKVVEADTAASEGM
jgi:hypothetical protein